MEHEHILPNIPLLHGSLHHMHVDKQTYMRADHMHTELEIVYILQGRLLCRVGTQTYRLKQGDVCMIPGMVAHRLLCDDTSAEFLYMQFDADDMLAQIYPEWPPLSLLAAHDGAHMALIPQGSVLYTLLTFSMQEILERAPHYETAVKGALVAAVVCMQRARLLPDVAEWSATPAYQKIRPALRYATEHLSDKISLGGMCRELRMDKYNFCKYFKRAVGMSFFDYLTAVRMRRAEQLLADAALSMTDIALACGYSSAAYFTRVFTAKWRCSPSAYRTMLREGG